MDTKIEYLPVERGRGWKKEAYWSICSAHQRPIKGCPRCEVGAWSNLLEWRFWNFVYHLSPWFWKWWVNRPIRQRRKG